MTICWIVKLERPAPYFPQCFTHSATFPIYSEEAAKSHDPRIWVSNGPTYYPNWTPGSKLKLQQNSWYWDQAHVQIPNIEYIPIPDENAEFRQYRAGQLDITQSVPSGSLTSVKQNSPTNINRALLGDRVLRVKSSSPYFAANLNLRKSLAMAIDRKAKKHDFCLSVRPAYGFVPPGTWNYDPQSWEWHDLPIQRESRRRVEWYALAGFPLTIPSPKSSDQFEQFDKASCYRDRINVEASPWCRDRIVDESTVFSFREETLLNGRWLDWGGQQTTMMLEFSGYS